MINDSYILKGVTIQNRAVFQPMEGCDCNADGSPSELTIQKYIKAAESGVGIVWFEANAVCSEGRTNAGQMQSTEQNADKFRALLSEMREIAQGERIAQLVIAPFLKASFEEADELCDTARGEGGFGSTGR